MRAAVVTSFDSPPTYQDFRSPEPHSAHEVVVDVVAAGLHPRVRSQANGSHYTSSDELPLVPGIDGVGRAPDGTLRYFVLPDTAMGSMAEQTVVDLRRSVVLPAESDPVRIAAAMNPAMSSWLALRRRVDFQAGQSVLVLGATGNAGRLAIQVAKRLGASKVIGAGRSELESLDALGHAARDVDVVLDYLWGQPTADAMAAVVTTRADRGRPLTWIQVGSVAGLTAPIPSAALRAARLQIVGSGQGSIPARVIVSELPALADAINDGTFEVNATALPLADIDLAWRGSSADKRVVITP